LAKGIFDSRFTEGLRDWALGVGTRWSANACGTRG
jgi:hypothetical protein